jgi:hypothetical protein
MWKSLWKTQFFDGQEKDNHRINPAFVDKGFVFFVKTPKLPKSPSGTGARLANESCACPKSMLTVAACP